MEIKNSNGLIDMYIYGIKMAYNDILLDYKWLKNNYRKICEFRKKLYKSHLEKNEQSYNSVINFHFNRYEEDLNYILSLIENPPLNLDFSELSQIYFQQHNITLNSLMKLYKMIFIIYKRSVTK